nr:hypothetical protein [uncultured Arsenicibacter sp.]
MEKKKLSAHSAGPQQVYSPTPWAAGCLLIRMGFSLLWQHIRQEARRIFWAVMAWVIPCIIGLAAVVVMLTVCHFAGSAADWCIDLLITPFLRLLQ